MKACFPESRKTLAIACLLLLASAFVSSKSEAASALLVFGSCPTCTTNADFANAAKLVARDPNSNLGDFRVSAVYVANRGSGVIQYFEVWAIRTFNGVEKYALADSGSSNIKQAIADAISLSASIEGGIPSEEITAIPSALALFGPNSGGPRAQLRTDVNLWINSSFSSQARAAGTTVLQQVANKFFLDAPHNINLTRPITLIFPDGTKVTIILTSIGDDHGGNLFVTIEITDVATLPGDVGLPTDGNFGGFVYEGPDEGFMQQLIGHILSYGIPVTGSGSRLNCSGQCDAGGCSVTCRRR